jgi:flagellar hook protein FlgE
MSLYGVLRTGVSGMAAQSTKLGTIADNIANTGTIGYKRASTEFSSLILESGPNNYDPGAVNSQIRYSISSQGSLNYTTSTTDLAIQGNGFMVVSDRDGTPYLTRAGAFVVDGSSGNLVNAAGFTLMGYDISEGGPAPVLNGFAGLTPVNISSLNMKVKPSTTGTFQVNVDSNASVVSGDTPADNLATSSYTSKSSVVAFDNLGNEITLDIYMTKTNASPAEWEVSAFNQADAASGGGFPYSSGPLASDTLTFDSSGQLTGTSSLAVPIPNGQTLTLDLSGSTQLAAPYTPLAVQIDGNPASNVAQVQIDSNGTIYATYENGSRTAVFRIPLADVASPDRLSPLAGNVYAITTASGDLQIDLPTSTGRGSLISGALEQSNVDMASELTDMIVSQRDYTANSKVVQTGSELLDVLMNLKR